MVGVLRTLWMVAVLVVPGAFALVVLWVGGRMLLHAIREARRRSNGAAIQARDVLAGLTFGAVVREARSIGFYVPAHAA